VSAIVQSEWQIELTEHGGAVIESVVSPFEISELLLCIERDPLPRSRAGIRHALRHPAVRAVAHDTRLLSLAHAVLGPAAFPFRATVFDKSSQFNWLVAWHQDKALPLVRKIDAEGWGTWSTKDGYLYAHAPASALSQVLALRLHLDDSTQRNGPLRILPGTHTLGLLTDDRMAELAGSSSISSLTVVAGGAIVIRPLVVHSSQKSENDCPRRVLHIEYAATRHFDCAELAITD
jgi:hypothetical protein